MSNTVTINADNNEVTVQTPSSISGGVSAFLDLSDTPSSFSGQAGKIAAVNGGEDALEFIAASGTGTVTSVALTVPTGLAVTGSPITTSGTIDITLDTGYVIPTQASLDDIVADSVQLTGGAGDQGKLSWNTDEETLDLIQNGATLQLGQETQIHCRNNTGSTITNGTVVMATGTIGASGRITIAPMVSDGSISAKYLLGVATEDIANNTDGKVTNFGKVRGLNTSSYSEGVVLYTDPTTAGALTATLPEAPNLKLPIAFVINSHASNGTLFVRVTPSNDLAEDHLVELATLAEKDLLSYNATTERFENRTISAAGLATSAQGALADSATQPGDNVSDLTNDVGYITGNQTITFSGDVTGSGTTSIPLTIGTAVVEEAMLSTAVQTKLNNTAPSKFDATAAPTANDDDSNTGGNGTFSEGSVWIDVTNDEAYRCVDASTGAAIWINTTLTTSELGTMATQNANSVAITGGSIAGIASYNKVAITAPATSATLTLANGSTLATSGANSITLTSTGATNVTLPTTGTLATRAQAETLTNKTISFSNNTLTNVMSTTTAQSVTAGIKKTFQANATNAGFRLAGVTANPSTLVAGDLWYRTDSEKFTYRGASAARSLVEETLTQTLTNKTIAYSSNTISGLPVEFTYAISDETTDLTTGTGKVTFRMPFAMTLTAVRASVTTAPTGSTLVVDINEGGATILSTKLSIDASEKTSTTAATPVVISDSSLADDAEITIDIDQVGSVVAGAGLKVTLIGTRS